MLGLSPRVRGNRVGRRNAHLKQGSIPACAGEPLLFTVGVDAAKVYPRVCGGTSSRTASSPPSTGLSPRVRGNLFERIPTLLQHGSIPACAGEPLAHFLPPKARGVYPRVCGGTFIACNRPADMGGLSPRVRGNPMTLSATTRSPGSIPACAGEPGPSADGQTVDRVYPRVCGGTVRGLSVKLEVKGLSPRVRGNHLS